MAQGLLLQVAAPLQFLGWFYRELRQSLVDMEAFFKILLTQPKLPDGDRTLPQPNIVGTATAVPQHTPSTPSKEHTLPQNGQRHSNGCARRLKARPEVLACVKAPLLDLVGLGALRAYVTVSSWYSAQDRIVLAWLVIRKALPFFPSEYADALCRNDAMEASTSGRNTGVSIELRNVSFG